LPHSAVIEAMFFGILKTSEYFCDLLKTLCFFVGVVKTTLFGGEESVHFGHSGNSLATYLHIIPCGPKARNIFKRCLQSK